MRTDREKALAMLDREIHDSGLELVIHNYRDASGAMLLIQEVDSIATLAEISIGWQRDTAEDIVRRGHKALAKALERRGRNGSN